MMRRSLSLVLSLVLLSTVASSADWVRFRGPDGLGISSETGLPVKWSSGDNIAWKVDLPGPGASSPVVLGNRVIITSYSGYGLKPSAGDQKNLKRHMQCFDRRNGKPLWHKTFDPKLPEHKYQGEGAYHGYAACTPISDGKRLYVFFGKSGLFCFDLDGNQLWQKSAGNGLNRWGSGCSPILFGKLVIINASVESGSIIAFNKETGSEVWRAKGIRSSWNTPLLVKTTKGTTELVVSIQGRILAFDPTNGKALWNAEGVHRYVCPSVVAHAGVVYVIGGGHTSLAVKAGGKGDVTKSHVVWRHRKGSNVSSPIYYKGHLYWASDSGGYICCQDAKTGKTVFQKRLTPRPGRIWTSPILADGKLYFLSQHNGLYVVAAKPKFELIAHNQFKDDTSRSNASPAVSNGQIFLRTDRKLYCIGKK